MAFEQVRDVIERARRFHEELARFYERQEVSPAREKVRLLLEYLRAHEQRMAEELGALERTALAGVLDTWFKYSPGPDLLDAVRQAAIRPDMTPHEVIAEALALDQHLLDLYQQAVERAPIPDVREALLDLYAEGLKQRALVVRDVYEPEEG